MTTYNFTFVVDLVDTQTQPTLQISSRDPVRQLYGVGHADLWAVKRALDRHAVNFECDEDEVDDILVEKAILIVANSGNTTSIQQYYVNGSRPVGSQWASTAERYLHPTEDGHNVCVYVEYRGTLTIWYQLRIYAQRIYMETKDSSSVKTKSARRRKA